RKNVRMLVDHGIFTEEELKSRYEITLENYCKTVTIEANTMTAMAKTQIIPAINAYTADLARSANAKKILDADISCSYEIKLIKKLTCLTERMAMEAEELEQVLLTLHDIDETEKASLIIRDQLLQKMGELRIVCDEAETLTAKSWWPYPTYSDLLFSVK
ncbi:MAG: glutamine synthetase type III, partial [Anaerotignum sp.]|nr:glutamine synthetase type III [Anaerotignum sp.]